MESKTIGGNVFSLVSSLFNSTKEIIPLSRSGGISACGGFIQKTRIVYFTDEESNLEYFKVSIEDNANNVIASTVIEKKSGKIVKVEPQEEKNRLEIFNILFYRNMLDFSSNKGMLPLDLAICISMLYGNDNNLRLFFQQAYVTYQPIEQQSTQSIESVFYNNICDSVDKKEIGKIVNIIGFPNNYGHVDVLIKLSDKGFKIFDTSGPNSLFYLIEDTIENLLKNKKGIELDKNKNEIFIIDENGFQGPMSCFLMIISFLGVCKNNQDFLTKIDKYFENNVGHFMVLQQLLCLIDNDKDILKLKIKENSSSIMVSEITSKFIYKGKNGKYEINDNFYLFMKDINKYIPLKNVVNIDVLTNLLNNLGEQAIIITIEGYKTPDFITKISRIQTKEKNIKDESEEDEKYFQKLLNKYLRILSSRLNEEDLYFNVEEQNILVSNFINTTILTKLNNDNNIVFGYRENIRELIPEFDTSITRGNPIYFIYTLGTEHNQNADAGIHYVAAQIFVNPIDNRLTVLHYNALNGELSEEFSNYIHSNFGIDNIDIVNIPLDQNIRQRSNNTCGLYALTALRENGILDRERIQIIEKSKNIERPIVSITTNTVMINVVSELNPNATPLFINEVHKVLHNEKIPNSLKIDIIIQGLCGLKKNRCLYNNICKYSSTNEGRKKITEILNKIKVVLEENKSSNIAKVVYKTLDDFVKAPKTLTFNS